MRNESFLAMILLLALVLLMGVSGCAAKAYKGGTPYSEALCEAGQERRALGMPQGMDKVQWDYETLYICSGGIQ